MRAPVVDLGCGTDPELMGGRASWLGRLRGAGLPVPDGFSISVPAVGEWAREGKPGNAFFDSLSLAVERLESRVGKTFGEGKSPFLLAIRQSPVVPGYGLQPTILNVGAVSASVPGLASQYGEANAWRIRSDFLQGFAIAVLGAEPELFESLRARMDAREAGRLADLATQFETALAEAGFPVPDTPVKQLEAAIGCLSRPRYGPPAGQAILVQVMAQDIGGGDPGTGVLRTRSQFDGLRNRSASFREGWSLAGTPAAQGVCNRLLADRSGIWGELEDVARRAEDLLCEALEISFAVGVSGLQIVNAVSLRLEPRGQAAFTKELVDRSLLSREEAVSRIDPVNVEMMLHARVDPGACSREICRGVAAAPGAAVGKLVFSAVAAERPCQPGRASRSGQEGNQSRRCRCDALCRGSHNKSRWHDQPRGRGDSSAGSSVCRRGCRSHH